MLEKTNSNSPDDGGGAPPISTDISNYTISTSAPVQPVQTPINEDNWTKDLPATEQVRLFRSVDWSATLLGPVASWNLALRLYTFQVLADSRPACVYWGPAKIAIYNEAFAVMAGGAHPMLMGSTFQQAFPELWGDIQGVFAGAEATGRAVDVVEIPLFTERNGYLEETYFTGNFNPLRDIDGKINGFYNAAHEITKSLIDKRRTTMLKPMTVPSGLQVGNLASHVMPFLEQNRLDVTMALLYEVDDESCPGTYTVHLRGNIGVPAGHALAVETADLRSLVGLIPSFRKAKSGIITEAVDERFEGVAWRGFGEPSKHFSTLPLSGAGRLFGYLVVGANSRRAIDEDHHQFMLDISSKISWIAASIVSIDEAKRRADRLEKELRDSERQVRYMAQHASVGMIHMSIDGTLLWANEQYYKLTGHPRPDEPQYKFSFVDVFHDEDRKKTFDSWERLIRGQSNLSIELRLKELFTPPSGDPEPMCVLALSFPYVEDGEVKSVMACITDVSQLKWAESIEARKAADAREAKRQQEEFIDIVSHEMRNPLSAIFHCADMIESSFEDCKAKGLSEQNLVEALQSNVEFAKTILMCSNHQKRIVNDVLTLSKLEYMMLSISPRPVQPVILVERAIRMFEADLQSHAITVTTIAEPSLEDNHVDWILCDPSRVAQIFINLLTNAIKFTKGESKKELIVRYGARLSDPRKAFSNDINWAPSQSKVVDLTTDAEWGDGESLYLTISISDTGVGMTSDEIKKLFHRFKQASSKTSIKYGGSGLGLFISQKLTEKQGGEIGVASNDGKGSTFAFYVKARRTQLENSAVESQIHRPASARSKSELKTIETKESVPSAMHVLLVEDNVVNQKVLSKQLARAGCIVYIANQGLEALDFIKTSNIWHERKEGCKQLDIVLMDWEMPQMDGLTACREIRAWQKDGKLLRHIEIIAITANAREEQLQIALESGFDSIMSKPFMASDLLLKMRELLGHAPQRALAHRTLTTP